MSTDKQQNKTPRYVTEMFLITLLAAWLMGLGCSVAEESSTGEDTADEDTADEDTADTAGHDVVQNSTASADKSDWAYTIDEDGPFGGAVATREIGRATVERLEHIAETLDLIATLLENQAKNDGQQQPPSLDPDNRTGQQGNERDNRTGQQGNERDNRTGQQGNERDNRTANSRR